MIDADPEPTAEDHRIANRLMAKSRARRRLRRFAAVLLTAVVVAGALALEVPDRIAQFIGSQSTPETVAAPVAVTPIAMPAGAIPATVDSVHDGDTLFLLIGGERVKVRLLAVDTPEVGGNLECFGDESTAHLRQLLPEGSTVSTLADAEPYDQYDRSLLFVWSSTGTLVNQALVADGYAEAVFIGGNRLFEPEIEAAEDAAQAAGLGIWGAC